MIFLKKKGAAAYSINAVEFDGTNDELNVTTGFSATGSKFALIVFAVYFPSPWNGSLRLLTLHDASGVRVEVETGGTGKLQGAFYNSAGTSIANFTTGGGTFPTNNWHVFALDLDTTTGTERIAVHNWNGTSWSSMTLSASGVTADGVIDDVDEAHINITTHDCYMADFWVSIGETLDMSQSANQDKFVPAISKGSDGSTPTGTAPHIFLSGPTVDWHTNKGSTGGFTEVGALTDAPSVPT